MKHHRSVALFFMILFLTSLACSTLLPKSALTTAPTEFPELITTEAALPVSISVGATHACTLLNNGHVMCWGDNSAGQLGDGTYIKHSTATEVLRLTDIISI